MKQDYESLKKVLNNIVEELENKLPEKSKIKEMFNRCFINTINTTVEPNENDLSFVLTGDIPAMWLRDSVAQVRHYLPFAKEYREIDLFIQGVIKRQFMYIAIDPYANSFNREANGKGHKDDITKQNDWVWERKYEIDSLCYPVQLIYKYWNTTNNDLIFTEEVRAALFSIIDLWTVEQRHNEKSSYSFERKDCAQTDTLENQGKGNPVIYTGMTWSGFRPSDDACDYGYLIPSNMFAVVILGYVEEIAKKVYKDIVLEEKANKLKTDINNGIEKYGIYEHPKYGSIYAYETDGNGNYNLMDDANIPSLLSIPYIEYKGMDDPIYINTRKFILSEDNPYYFIGTHAQGVGSPHTPEGYIWHIALIMQALTSKNPEEIEDLITSIEKTDGKTGYMHESFDANNPDIFSRSWFAWANSLFGELIYAWLIEKV